MLCFSSTCYMTSISPNLWYTLILYVCPNVSYPCIIYLGLTPSTMCWRSWYAVIVQLCLYGLCPQANWKCLWYSVIELSFLWWKVLFYAYLSGYRKWIIYIWYYCGMLSQHLNCKHDKKLQYTKSFYAPTVIEQSDCLHSLLVIIIQ